ncbi:hypothetical protein KEM52_002200 [Ascosphaera acerosa]|nr:hypothetical protein KEM52_002200 [Ascosphaera acerosa]
MSRSTEADGRLDAGSHGDGDGDGDGDAEMTTATEPSSPAQAQTPSATSSAPAESETGRLASSASGGGDNDAAGPSSTCATMSAGATAARSGDLPPTTVTGTGRAWAAQANRPLKRSGANASLDPSPTAPCSRSRAGQLRHAQEDVDAGDDDLTAPAAGVDDVGERPGAAVWRDLRDVAVPMVAAYDGNADGGGGSRLAKARKSRRTSQGRGKGKEKGTGKGKETGHGRGEERAAEDRGDGSAAADVAEGQPGYKWLNKRAQEEAKEAQAYVVDKDFSLAEFGDPYEDMEVFRARAGGN